GPLDIKNVLAIAIQIASGLAAAHEKGIVHRDLKPANIVITPKGQVKILDFGLAKLINQRGTGGTDAAGASELTNAGAVVGTPSHMSPEQVLNTPVDQRSDLFSLGVILYEMAAGESPFWRPALTVAQIMHAVAYQQPP